MRNVALNKGESLRQTCVRSETLKPGKPAARF